MKKYGVLLAVVALVLSSLACKTVMGAKDQGFSSPSSPDMPSAPDMTDVPQPGDIPTLPPISAGGDGGVTVGGKSEFPMTSDATNVVSAAGTLTYQTKMDSDAVIKFYRDEFKKQGYKEDASKAVTFGKTFTMAFTGHKSGKEIYVVGADAGDGSIYVTITLG
jgi:hypothetical protein